jgi:hypothetical protein
MVTVSWPVVTEVSVVPKPTILKMLPLALAGFPYVWTGPQQIAFVNTTGGVKNGSEDIGSPPSGASIIHSAVLPRGALVPQPGNANESTGA